MRKAVLPLFILLSLNLFVFLSIHFIPSTKAVGSTIAGGHISENATWTLEGGPYIVVEDVIVESDVFLTIKPGVFVKFTRGTNLVVDGSLIAQGNSTHKITFTSNAITPAPNDWGSVKIRNYATLEHCVVEYASGGIYYKVSSILAHSEIRLCGVGIDIKNPDQSLAKMDVEVLDVKIANNSKGLQVWGYTHVHPPKTRLNVSDSVFTNNYYGIYGGGVLLVMKNCSITKSTGGGGVRLSWYSESVIIDSIFSNNSAYGISSDGPVRLNNVIVSNSTGDGVTGQTSGTILTINNSNITQNGGRGVRGSTASISNSYIASNNLEGVSLWYSGHITQTTITDNNKGVSRDRRTDTHTELTVHFSNLFNNSLYDVYNPDDDNVNATYNWWGTTNETLIEEHIYDYYDDHSLGVVSYVPFLNSSASTLYSLTVDPIFYDITGKVPIQPSSWSIRFPNGTIRTVSSPVTCNQTQIGKYSIVSIIWKGVEVIPDITPTTLLISDMVWSPSINCLLPTSLTISLDSSASYVGFHVEINGNLTCNEVGISGAPILVSYSVTGGTSWNDITLVNTASDGSYSAVWMPSATGNYLVRATWSGNSAYPGTNTTVSLAVTPYEEQCVFSVESNSTISALAFNTTNWTLSFTATGPNGTRGYTKVTVAKSLVENITNIRVYLDGNQLEYNVTSTDDSWLLTFTYTHSTHKVAVDIDINIIPEFPSMIILPLFMIATLLAVIIHRRKHAMEC